MSASRSCRANVSTPAPSDSSIPSPQISLFSDDGTRDFTTAVQQNTPTRHPKHTRDCNLFQAAPIDAFTDEYQRSPGTTFLPSCCAIIVFLHKRPLGNGNSDPAGSIWSGFRLVGDNLDKTIKPRNMRLSRQSTFLHYFNVYAVKDRINFSHLNSNATLIDF
ncbi:hypothetical protein EMCRGX_G020815 [Ephydatia muelleri]